MTGYPILEPKKPGQRRLLAFDGGGIRGLITLGILEKIEADLQKALNAGDGFRLADYFDFIGGTSTGAILAVGLSIGLSVRELVDFYLEAGPLMFKKEELFNRLWSKFKSDPLEEKLKKVLGADTRVGSPRLRTLVLLVMRNATTDSPWPITNNPLSKYNNPARADCNLNLPAWQLVRASTAAPTFFPPEVIVLVAGGILAAHDYGKLWTEQRKTADALLAGLAAVTGIIGSLNSVDAKFSVLAAFLGIAVPILLSAVQSWRTTFVAGEKASAYNVAGLGLRNLRLELSDIQKAADDGNADVVKKYINDVHAIMRAEKESFVATKGGSRL